MPSSFGREATMGNVEEILIMSALGLSVIVNVFLFWQSIKTYNKNRDTLSDIKLSEPKYKKVLSKLTEGLRDTESKKVIADQNWVALQIHKLEIQDLEQQLPFLLGRVAPKIPLRVIVTSNGRALLDTGEVGNVEGKVLVKLLELQNEGTVTTTMYGPADTRGIILDNLQNIAKSVEEASKKYYHTVTDPMTNIYNRWGISNKLRTEVKRSSRFEHTLSLLLLDLDKFKEVNDRYGHAAGDEVIAKVAEILSTHTREVDIVGRNVVHSEILTLPIISQNVVGRFGEKGDEFVILLPETKSSGAVKLAGEMLRTIEQYEFKFKQQKRTEKFHIHASIGIASHPDVALDEIELLAKADAALYRSKRKDPKKGFRITVAKKSRKGHLAG